MMTEMASPNVDIYTDSQRNEKIGRFLKSAKKNKWQELLYSEDVVENSKILLEVSIDNIKNYPNNDTPITISSLYLCCFLHAICQGGIDDDNLKKRLDLIFEAIDNNIFEIEEINRGDRLQLTPLHYTICLKDTDKTKTLLKGGATLAVKDDLKFMPFHTKEEFEEILDFLMPQKENRKVIPIMPENTTACFKINMANLLPEENTKQLQSEFLLVIAQKFPLLLKHPLVLCLIAAFWVKAGRIFFLQLFFSTLFTLCFLISSFYFGDSNVLIIVFVLVFEIITLLQLTFICNRNFRNLENYFSLLINVISMSLGFLAVIVRDVTKCYYAVTNLIIMIQYLFMFSICSKKVEMLKIVFITFVKCLIILAFLLLVFAFSLYLLSNQTDNFIFTCYKMGLSILTAELNGDFSGNIWTNTFSKVIFVIFVLFICIMLTNFLNSLAVSDVQELQRDADLNSIVQLVKYIFALDYLFSIPKSTYFRIQNTVVLEGDRTKSLSVFDIFRTDFLDERWMTILNESLIKKEKINLTYNKYNIDINADNNSFTYIHG